MVCQSSINGVDPVVVPGSVALALAIGIVVGGFPAHRAAGLRPVEAPRHE